MNSITFFCHGHINTLATHRNTFEFTKDKELSKRGDCIIGVNADFGHIDISKMDHVKIELEVHNIKEVIHAIINKDFIGDHEIVGRRSDFSSERTLFINCDKAAIDIDRKLVELMKDPKTKMKVTVHEEINHEETDR